MTFPVKSTSFSKIKITQYAIPTEPTSPAKQMAWFLKLKKQNTKADIISNSINVASMKAISLLSSQKVNNTIRLNAPVIPLIPSMKL